VAERPLGPDGLGHPDSTFNIGRLAESSIDCASGSGAGFGRSGIMQRTIVIFQIKNIP